MKLWLGLNTIPRSLERATHILNLSTKMFVLMFVCFSPFASSTEPAANSQWNDIFEREQHIHQHKLMYNTSNKILNLVSHPRKPSPGTKTYTLMRICMPITVKNSNINSSIQRNHALKPLAFARTNRNVYVCCC